MARRDAEFLDKAFTGGLITDYTALNFPENACTNTLNVIFDPSGRVERREGFDFEENFELLDTTRTNKVMTSYLWKEVNGNGNVNLFVVQIGGVLHFYETTADSISNGEIATTVALSTYVADPLADVAILPCQFTHGRGVLFVTHPNCDPFYVTFISNTIGSARITVKIRDLVGVEDSLAVDERPVVAVGSMTKEHKYNLFNQGWYFNSNAALTAWDTARTDLPSSADVWWYYKGTTDAFDATTIANRDKGNTPAPKGHYIVDAFDIDRSTVSGIASIPVVDTGDKRPRVVAFFAGRAWYGGVESKETLNKLYFSQVLEDDTQFGLCYQANDPTSETLFDLLPTDGGVIEVSGAGTIHKLFPMGNSLLVFASNGVWAIAGSQGIGFVANDFSVVKISAVEVNNSSSFVNVEGQPFWWTGDAICTVVTQDNLTFNVQKVSDNKIRELILSIPEASKQQTIGSFNPYDRTIYWLYRTVEAISPDEVNVYDRILVLNLLTQAFYLFSIPDHDIKVHSIELFKGYAGDSAVVDVLVGADTVIDSGSDDVIIFSIQNNTSVPVFKYLVSYRDTADNLDKFTFAEIVSPEYMDWPNYADGGVSYTSDFTTGYKLHTGTQRFFQANYIFVFLEERLDNSSCYVQGVYDYAESGDTGKWSSKQQLYNTALLDRGVNFKRLKLRGKGRSLQLRFTSDSNKPFTIIGWSLWETSNDKL